MPTVNQLVRAGRVAKRAKSKVPALAGSPQEAGSLHCGSTRSHAQGSFCNSARARWQKVPCFTNGFEVIGYIGGEGHNLQEHSVVLIRGGRVKGPAPGRAGYHIVRGSLDTQGVKDRKQAGPSMAPKRPNRLKCAA